MSASDLCETCGGHGSLLGEAIPYEELSPRRQQGADNGQVYRRCEPCPDCDGEDHATPLAEARHEETAQ